VRAEVSSDKDAWDDNDYKEYGLVAGVKLENGWNLKAYGRYDDDRRKWNQVTIDTVGVDAKGALQLAEIDIYAPHSDRSGFLGDIFLNNDGAGCDFGFHAEFAYKAADVQGTKDDGMGGYVMLSKQMSSQFTPAVLAGMTKDGYVADNDFGFVMVGGDTSTQVLRVGDLAPEGLWFGAFVANYKTSDRLTLTGNFLYVDFDNSAAGTLDGAIEVSGVIDYAVNESTSLTYKAGYLTPSVNGGSGVDEDAYIAHVLRLNVKF
jgi:hypothetical protein